MRGFRGSPGWIVASLLALPMPVLAQNVGGVADSPQCRSECDAGMVTNPAVVRTCLARCEVRRATLGSRGPTGTTAMATPQSAWTLGPNPAARSVAAAPASSAHGSAVRSAAARRPGARGPSAPGVPAAAPGTAVAQATSPPGRGFMASVMGAQAATVPSAAVPAAPMRPGPTSRRP